MARSKLTTLLEGSAQRRRLPRTPAYLDLYFIHWPVAFDSGNDVRDLFPVESKDGPRKLDTKSAVVETCDMEGRHQTLEDR
ncbi:unnamed protein product [Tilletia laevis]|uniref:NADP-dependent oxidoreductase domain-containing protein n=1 Tax=Tilletia caries TaxID=13290 RepID=A0ABN7J2Y5_9BASI|nr:hypothetical protein CF335_g7659 [Tilletia laevis]KAE8185745.1 hypothetical protein CF328_g7448 [Tilletia controversa]CAD6948657.1 unnamed protein product [Tilletia caries]KAE8190202.1 hypothetical protein CF336_g5415 [Tilletia laevis]CAD6945259.1 unnamed protein product [Tilletia laevis]